jgi:glycosyltransferase involved in cell wall biosynthesis
VPKKRVLILIKGLGIGGAERLISEAVPFWDRERYEYRVAYLLPWKNQLVPELERANVPVDQIGNGRLGWITIRALRKFIDKTEPDLIHAHLPSTGILARLVARVPVIYTEHNVASSYRQPTRLLNRLTYKRNAETIAVSDAVAESISGYAEPVVIPNGVSVAIEGDESRTVRAELGLLDGTLLITHVGNIRPHKGHENLMAATRILLTHYSNFLVASIGAEKYPGDLDRLRATAETLGIDGAFQLLGRRPDAVAFLAAADIVVNPSDYEGLPLAVLEAMTLGKPVVATAVGGVPSAIKTMQNGILVPPRDPGRLADGLLELALSEELRNELGIEAMKYALEAHSLEAMVRSVENVYAEVLS